MSSTTVSNLALLFAAACATAGISTMAPAASPSGAKSAATLTPINACSLLSQKQVRQITGLAVEPGVRKDEGQTNIGAYSSTCVWWSANPAGGRKNFAILNAMTWPEGDPGAGRYLQSFHDAARNGTIGRAPVPLSLGDEAIWWGDGVAVRTDNVSFGVSVWIGNEPAARRRPMEEALAKIALQSLESV